MKKNSMFQELKQVLNLMGKRKTAYILTVVLSCTLEPLQRIAMSFLNKSLVDSITTLNMQLFVGCIAPVLVMILIACVMEPLATYVIHVIPKKTSIEIKLKAIAHIQMLPHSYFDKTHSGDILSRLSNDMGVLDEIYYSHIRRVLWKTVSGLGSFVAMLVLDYRVSIIMFLMGIASARINSVYATKIRAISDRIQEGLSEASQRIVDIVTGNREIKIFNIGRIALEKYHSSNGQTTEQMMNREKMNAQREGANYFISAFNLFGVITLSSVMAYFGLIQFGTVVALITLQYGVTSMFSDWGRVFSRLQGSLAGAQRIIELLNTAPEESSEKESVSEELFGDASVRIVNVSFAYDEQTVLDNINIQADPGQTIALVGGSGGGKSSLIKLILGFYRKQRGDILVRGVSVDQMTLSQLRDQLSYVPQDAYIFDGTIWENIQYGRPEASNQEIIDAAIAANAQEFIENMPDQYETLVGERGVKLSGGQRQRIAIARAVLKNAPILLLDEATSSLDSESERLVQSALEKLMKGRTSIVVAHRLSTIENADRIYVIERGKVDEQGTHLELMAKSGRYMQLHQLQFADEVSGGLKIS